MHLTLIGMSGIGKSYWSQLLASNGGYERVNCDYHTETERLGPELAALGFKGTKDKDISEWMGQPYNPQYRENSAKYLRYEREVMLEIIDRLKSGVDKPLVIDTGGSVINVGDDITQELRKLTRVIYLEASPSHTEDLFRNYIADPRPVIWGTNYTRKEGESDFDSLKRCYPNLLTSRAALYRHMAHVIIPYERHKQVGADIKSLFEFSPPQMDFAISS